MSFFPNLSSIVREEYEHDRPDTFVIMDSFTFNEINYLRTASFYYSKPIYKTRYKKIVSSEYNAIRSHWIQSISVSQARGLLPYTQLEMEF